MGALAMAGAIVRPPGAGSSKMLIFQKISKVFGKPCDSRTGASGEHHGNGCRGQGNVVFPMVFEGFEASRDSARPKNQPGRPLQEDRNPLFSYGFTRFLENHVKYIFFAKLKMQYFQ